VFPGDGPVSGVSAEPVRPRIIRRNGRAMNRKDGRTLLETRNLALTRGYLPYAEGSCLVELGMTRVIVSASVSGGVPQWLAGSGSGWVTAEYGMLPRATQTRNRRPATSIHQNGRTMEIQRLIGRALRAVTELDVLGERTIYVDCDVVNADGGTRVASIIGAAVALHDAGRRLLEEGAVERTPVRELVAAVSVGMVDGEVAVDLCYEEDAAADVDMNIVMTESGGLVEVQGTAEGKTFDRTSLSFMLDAAESAIGSIISAQKKALGIP